MASVLSQEELEVKILSGILSEEDNLLKCVNLGINPKYFVHHQEGSEIKYYAKIFQIIAEFYARYNEVITVESFQNEIAKQKIHPDKATRDKIVSNVSKAFGKALAENTEDSNFEYLIDDLKDRSIKREIIEYLPTVREAFAEKPASVVLENLIDKLTDIKAAKASVGQQTVTINAAGSAKDILALYEEERIRFTQESGVKIGLPEIDRATNGFREGQLVVILGEVGKGKSTVLLNWAVGAHEDGKNVLFFSFEMPRWQCISRYMAIKTNKNYDVYKDFALDDEDHRLWREFLEEEEAKHKAYFEIVDQPDNRTVEEIDFRIRKYEAAGKRPDAIFVDYLGNMTLMENQRGAKDYEIIAAATVKLRQLARRYRIPVITAQQINREGLKGMRKKEDAQEFEKMAWLPEMIQDSKKTMDYADFVIGINPKFDLDDPSGQNYMFFHKVKARDTHFDPFCCLYLPAMAKIIPIRKDSRDIQALFDGVDGGIFETAKEYSNGKFEDEDDVGDLN